MLSCFQWIKTGNLFSDKKFLICFFHWSDYSLEFYSYFYSHLHDTLQMRRRIQFVETYLKTALNDMRKDSTFSQMLGWRHINWWTTSTRNIAPMCNNKVAPWTAAQKTNPLLLDWIAIWLKKKTILDLDLVRRFFTIRLLIFIGFIETYYVCYL